MQLTLYTDYSLRMLIYLGVVEDATIAEIADHFHISRNHLVKVAHNLGKYGYIHTMRGRTGGLRLARDPEKIKIGEVVRSMEPNFNLVECFHREGNQCVITPSCGLKNVLFQAYDSFLRVLDSYTLADMLHNKELLAEELHIEILPASAV
ncbi:MAG: Rrf2 family transcriptional regulator [Candidatus Hydrogenedentes bacterium]|nr:Rrf2 family transcriptional regulator [Candidatus Hydrogenedentota bacterium]